MSDTTPLRERKRRATRRRIEDAATALVEKHGFEAVTVEDICRDADISRRTFFNYMESKDEAVLGRPPMELTEELSRRFIDVPSGNLVKTALELISASTAAAEDEDREAGADEEFLRTLRERRHRIITAEPAVALMSVTRFRQQARILHDLILEHFEAHPGDRKLPGEPVTVEASIIGGLIRESVWLHMSRLIHCPADPEHLPGDTGAMISTFAKELTW